MGEAEGADYPQLSASTLFFIAGPESLRLVDEWARWTDRPECCCPENDGSERWRQHRHDQSVLSILARRHSVQVMEDVTQFGPPERKCLQLHRAPPVFPRVVVITSTSGDHRGAVETVQAQTYPYVSHVVVLDGGPAREVPPRVVTDPHTTRYVSLPYRTGAKGFNGHMVYSTFPSLVCADERTYVAFLDDDCRWHPRHLESMVRALTGAAGGWAACAFSFRRILDSAGTLVCRDECESLGTCVPNVFGEHFVDTNCWLVSAGVAAAAARTWHVPARPAAGRAGEADRRLSTFIWRSGTRYVPTGRWTVDYTAKGGRSVAPLVFPGEQPEAAVGAGAVRVPPHP